jgi:hypothetical protein
MHFTFKDEARTLGYYKLGRNNKKLSLMTGNINKMDPSKYQHQNNESIAKAYSPAYNYNVLAHPASQTFFYIIRLLRI